jgi:hypothetical protein
VGVKGLLGRKMIEGGEDADGREGSGGRVVEGGQGWLFTCPAVPPGEECIDPAVHLSGLRGLPPALSLTCLANSRSGPPLSDVLIDFCLMMFNGVVTVGSHFILNNRTNNRLR